MVAFNNLGKNHYILGNYEKAEYYFKKLLDLSKIMEDEYTEQRVLNHLGRVFKNKGEYYIALEFFNKETK